MKKINKWMLCVILAFNFICMSALPTLADREAIINVSTETIKYSGENYSGNLIKIVTSSAYHKDISEKINVQLDSTVYARQLELLDYIKGFGNSLKPYDLQAVVDSDVKKDFPRIYVGPSVLSVNVYSSWFTGGPHPWGRYHTANFDLDTGKILHLSDVFSSNSHWEKMAQLLSDLLRQIPYADRIFDESDMTILANKEVSEWKREDPISGWTLTDEGLSFFYYAGEKSIYAAGDKVITFSIEQLRSLGIKEKYISRYESTDGGQSTSVIGEKRSQSLSVKTKKVSVKAKKLKGKKQTVSRNKVFVIKGDQGMVTFKKVSGNKKIHVSKTGKITLKKGLRRGRYKVKVKISASGNDFYEGITKTVVVRITVK